MIAALGWTARFSSIHSEGTFLVMAAEAIYLEDADILLLTAGAGYASGKMLRLDDRRTAVVQGLKAIASGDVMGLRRPQRSARAVGWQFQLLHGGEEVYWDISANTAIKASEAEDGDFYVGPAAKAKTSGQTRQSKWTSINDAANSVA